MAVTTVHVTTLTANAAVANPVGTTIDPANTHAVDCSTFPAEELLLRITQTDATARIATVTAGDNPPADAAGQGALTKSMAQNEIWWVGPLTSARFLQNDSTVVLTFAASFAGVVEAFRVPRTA